MDPFGAPVEFEMERSGRGRLSRVGTAGMVLVGWLALGLADLVLSVMFFTEPSYELLFLTSPVLLLIPWILAMANARGKVVVRPDALEIHHARVLRRPLVVPRTQVARVLLDDGRYTGRARFVTGDPVEPLLWTDPVPRRQRDDVPLIGDALLPNVAIVLSEPLPMDAARSAIAAVPAGCEIAPPRRSGRARALLLAMKDLEAVRRGLVGWRVEQPDAPGAIPPQVAVAAARVPQDAGVLIALATFGALCLATRAFVLLPVWFAVSLAFASQMVRRRQAAAAEARAAVAQRSAGLSDGDRAAALAAIDANLGTRASVPPPPRVARGA